MSGRSRAGALALATTLVFILCTAFSGIQAHAEPAKGGSDYNLEITELTPRLITNQNTVKVAGSVRIKEAQENLVLHLFVRSDSMVTVYEAQSYLDGESYRGQYITSIQLDNVSARTDTPFSFEIPTEDLPFYNNFFWGPRGVEVRTQAGDELVSDRSLLVWDSGYEVEPLNLSVISSIAMGVASSPDGITGSYPAQDAQRVALNLAKTKGVTLAVDAGLLESEGFVTELAKARPSPIISLPSANADVAGIAHLSQRSEIPRLVKDSKLEANLRLARKYDIPILDDFLLPQTKHLDREIVSLWTDQTIVSPGEGLNPLATLTYDPSAWSRYDAREGTAVAQDAPGVDVLVTYDALSELLSKETSSKGEELDTAQMIRSTTAIVTRQLPNRARTIVALTEHNTSAETVVERVKAALGERWVNPISASEVITLSEEPEARSQLPNNDPALGSITDDEVRALYAAIESTAAMTSALTDSTGIVSEQRSRVLLATSLSLREQPNLRSQLIADANEEAEALATSVKVEQSAPINLLDRKALLPVRVSSDFNEPVNAVVELVSPDPRLQIDQDVAVAVPAMSSIVAEIPVRAVGSGNVTVQVKVKGPNGLVIDDATKLQIRVRAEWESVGTLIFSIALSLLVIVGIWRTIRRGRRVDSSRQPANTRVSEAAIGGKDE